MFWALLTAFIAAIAGALTGYALHHMSRRRLPRTIIPVSAGLGMLAATVALEYGWYENVLDTMAPDLVVISEREQQSWYQPWTYARPFVRGFIGYSPSEVVETAPRSGIAVVQLRRQERWQPQMVLPSLVDCAGERRAEVTQATEFDATGAPLNARWIDVDADTDPILSSLCGGEAAGRMP